MVFIAGLCVCEHGTVVYLQYNTQNVNKKSNSGKYFFSFIGDFQFFMYANVIFKLTFNTISITTPQISLSQRMLGWSPRLLRLWHRQSDTLN